MGSEGMRTPNVRETLNPGTLRANNWITQNKVLKVECV